MEASSQFKLIKEDYDDQKSIQLNAPKAERAIIKNEVYFMSDEIQQLKKTILEQ